MGRVLVVDDDEQILRIVEAKLKKDFKEVFTTSSPQEALRVAGRFDVVLVDQKMPELSGTELVEEIHRRFPELPVVIMTAFGSIEDAIESIKSGAYHYVTKPVNFDELTNILNKAIETKRLRERVKDLEEFLGIDVVAESPQMRRVLDTSKKVAPFDTSVLITGESGVGKEVVAKLIHRSSRRSKGPFIAINCAALPDNLIEAELFGYKKGSFSGAYTDKKGIVEEAEGGTLFLDEIGDLPLSLQAKLLRLLQEKEIRPIGSNRPKRVDVRVLCATNRNLKEMVEKGEFREDLFYRINVIHIHIPPLRERKEDILPLAYFFIKRSAEKFGTDTKELSESAKRQLLSYDWPGNIRELENTIERSFILSEGTVIERIYFHEDTGVSESFTGVKPYHEAKEEFERNYLKKILEISGGNISKASRLSGKTRAEIYRLMRKYGLSR